MAEKPLAKCELVGKQYHRTKYQLKKLLKTYGMQFGGSREYPYWGGESEYVRGEFQREVNPNTGEEETKKASLAVFVRKDMKPTKFTTEFKAWCKKAEEAQENGIVEDEDVRKVRVPKSVKARAIDRKKEKELEEYAELTRPRGLKYPSQIESAEASWGFDVMRKAQKELGEEQGNEWFREWRSRR